MVSMMDVISRTGTTDSNASSHRCRALPHQMMTAVEHTASSRNVQVIASAGTDRRNL